MEEDQHSGDTSACIEFMKPNSWAKEDKPYQLLYMPNDGMNRINYGSHKVSDIPIHDMRPILNTLSLDKQGFMVAKVKSQMSYHDFWDEEKIKTVYAVELRQTLSDITGASSMFIHECVLRKRSVTPKSHIDGYGQPVSYAHTDYTSSYIQRLVTDLTGPNSPILQGRRVQMLNCWRPLRGPLRDWPLAVCDLRSVDADDVFAVDEVHATDMMESQRILYNPRQRWCYLKDQDVDEVLVFKSADTHVPGEVPHASFQDPKCPIDAPMRESIEFRVLVVY